MDEAYIMNEFKTLLNQCNKLINDKNAIHNMYLDQQIKIDVCKNLQKNFQGLKNRMHKVIDSIEPIYDDKNIQALMQIEKEDDVEVENKKCEKLTVNKSVKPIKTSDPYAEWNNIVAEKIISIYDRSYLYLQEKDILKEIYEKMTNVYGIVWEQDYKEWRRIHQGIPKTLNIIYNNEQYKSIFETILDDKYENTILKQKDVLSPYELMFDLVSKRGDKSNGGVATLRLIYVHMENVYNVKWGRMMKRFEKENGRAITSKKELLYWNHGLIERFRLSIEDMMKDIEKKN